MDLQIREFSNAIMNFISTSELPNEVKRLVLIEIMQKVENATTESLKQQIIERDKEEGCD